MPADVLAFARPAPRKSSLQRLLDDVLTDAWSAHQGGDAVLDAVERLADALSQPGADTSAVLPALDRAHLWLCQAHVEAVAAVLAPGGDVPVARDRVTEVGGMLRRIWSLEDWLRSREEGGSDREARADGFWRWAAGEIE